MVIAWIIYSHVKIKVLYGFHKYKEYEMSSQYNGTGTKRTF